MKKIFTLISLFTLGTAAFSQIVFQSDLSSWTAGAPDGWMGTKTNIGGTNVIEVPMGSTYGASDAQLVNATATHKRFTTQPLSVTNGQGYEIKFWVKGQGQIRTGLFDDHVPTTTSGYIYNSYVTVNTATTTEYTQTITALNTNASAEFILSVVSTVGPGHLIVDSVSISEVTVAPPPMVSIYDIQYTTDISGDSPENGNILTTSGIVTGVFAFGSDADRFFIQDGDGAWNGIYVYNTTPVALGDSVVVTGTVTEYFGLTEIGTVTSVVIASSGNAQPNPVLISTGDAAQEQYEAVLVQVTDALCSSADDGFGGFTVSDGSGNRVIDDQIIDIYPITPTVNNVYEVTGVTFLSFSEVKIYPRIPADITVLGYAGLTENQDFSIYPNPASEMVVLNVQPNALVQIYSMSGALVYEGNGKTTLNVSGFEPGIYAVTVLQNETISTQKLIVK